MIAAGTAPPSADFANLFNAIPVGLAVVDADRRLVLMNPAFQASLGLDPDRIQPGIRIEDVVRAYASRGIYRPGEPQAPVKAILAGEHTRLGRLTLAGRSYDLYDTPLPNGGSLISAMDVSGFLAARADAEDWPAEPATALSTLRIGLAIFNRQGALLLSNARFAELMDLPPDHATPVSTFRQMLDLMETREAFDRHDRAAFVATLRHLGRSATWTGRRARVDGQLVDVMHDPLPGGGWAITVNDVTPLARAQDEAMQRAHLLDSVLLAVPHGICVYGPDRRVMMFNQTYQQVMQGAPLQVGDHLAEVIRRRAEAGEYGPGTPDAVFDHQISFDISRTQSRRRVRPNGSAIDVRTAPLPNGGHISVVTDITALVQAETEARKRAEEMGAMLDSLHHGIMLWDAEKRLVASNPIVCELYGLSPELLSHGRLEAEVIEKLLEKGYFGVGEAAAAKARELAARDRSSPHKRQVHTPNGRVLTIQSTPTPSGGWVSTILDVTETQAAEAELRQAKAVAEAANKAKSRFLATMSHELRTPLNAIIGFSDALMRQTLLPPVAAPLPPLASYSAGEVAEYGGQINAAGKQLLAMINTILDVARIETGRFEPGDEIVDIAGVLRRTVRQAKNAAMAAEVTLDCTVPDDLPWIRADERRMVQALFQLLSNALKFTEAGGKVTVEAGLAPDGGLWTRVSDTGIGIPESELERVFEPFTQVDEALSRRYGGTGLGLYTVRAVVAAQGGTVKLSSRPGKGTTAEISIPKGRVIY